MQVNQEGHMGLYQMPNPGAIAATWESYPSWTLWWGDIPLISMGCLLPWGHLGELWAVVSAHAVQYARVVLETCRAFVDTQVQKYCLRRVQTNARKRSPQGRRLCRALGLRQCGVWPHYGPRGDAVVWFVRHWYWRV